MRSSVTARSWSSFRKATLSMEREHLPVNIGNPQEITILQFAERIGTHFENASKIIFEPLPQDDPKQRCPDISKA